MAVELDARDLAVLPVDELALWLLQRMVAHSKPTFRRAHFLLDVLKSVGERMPGGSAYQRPSGPDEVPHLAKALGEAWDRLAANCLIAEAVTALLAQVPIAAVPSEGETFVTRLGERVAVHPRARSWLSAERRLGMTLHPRLEERARRQFVLGEFEAAAFVAMREVEIAVRERSGLPDGMLGTDLMNKAFADGGPLADRDAPPAERQGLQSLYRGAISVFKNPASHRRVGLDDPTEAAEVVLFADLLLRMLERTELPAQS
jgi:uncharacterized protein (TIGR02391 family)